MKKATRIGTLQATTSTQTQHKVDTILYARKPSPYAYTVHYCTVFFLHIFALFFQPHLRKFDWDFKAIKMAVNFRL